MLKKFFSDFKEFAMKGNVIDMALGVVIGSAFGKIVSSFVADVITPVYQPYHRKRQPDRPQSSAPPRRAERGRRGCPRRGRAYIR